MMGANNEETSDITVMRVFSEGPAAEPLTDASEP